MLILIKSKQKSKQSIPALSKIILIKSEQNGFTFIEIMAALAIMSIALIAILGLHSRSLTMNMADNFRIQAPLLAGKIIAEWETEMAVKGNALELNEALEGFPGYSYEISDRDIDSESVFSETAQYSIARIVELNCTILYNDGEYRYITKTLKIIP
jgi:prepilin-type N-terminal cleavage/methylation domain-containing protein